MLRRFVPSVLVMVSLVLGVVTLSSPSGAAPISKATAVKQLRKDVLPVTTAWHKWNAEEKKWNNSTTVAVIARKTTPLANAFLAFELALLNQSWPANARADVRAAYSATSHVVADLLTVGSLSLNDTTAISAWGLVTNRDVSAWGSAVLVVEHDLGLRVG